MKLEKAIVPAPQKSTETSLREQYQFGSVFTVPRPPVVGKTAWRTR